MNQVRFQFIETSACPRDTAILMDPSLVSRHFAFVDGVLCKLDPHARPIPPPHHSVDPTETITQE